ncbi:MAG: hypothetical protein U0992_05370 [Planctomycetaceae bacterium]
MQAGDAGVQGGYYPNGYYQNGTGGYTQSSFAQNHAGYHQGGYGHAYGVGYGQCSCGYRQQLFNNCGGYRGRHADYDDDCDD